MNQNEQDDRLAALAILIADKLIAHGSKSSSGLTLFLDHYTIKRIVLEVLRQC